MTGVPRAIVLLVSSRALSNLHALRALSNLLVCKVLSPICMLFVFGVGLRNGVVAASGGGGFAVDDEDGADGSARGGGLCGWSSRQGNAMPLARHGSLAILNHAESGSFAFGGGAGAADSSAL